MKIDHSKLNTRMHNKINLPQSNILCWILSDNTKTCIPALLLLASAKCNPQYHLDLIKFCTDSSLGNVTNLTIFHTPQHFNTRCLDRHTSLLWSRNGRHLTLMDMKINIHPQPGNRPFFHRLNTIWIRSNSLGYGGLIQMPYIHYIK